MVSKHPFNPNVSLNKSTFYYANHKKKRMALSSSPLKSVVSVHGWSDSSRKRQCQLMVHSPKCKSSECLNWLALLYFLNSEWPTVLIATVCALLKNSNKHQYCLPPVFDVKEFIKIKK